MYDYDTVTKHTVPFQALNLLLISSLIVLISSSIIVLVSTLNYVLQDRIRNEGIRAELELNDNAEARNYFSLQKTIIGSVSYTHLITMKYNNNKKI